MEKNIRKSLAKATCALLVTTGVQAENPQEVGDWDISSAFLLYAETDRVQLGEGIVNAKKLLDTDESLAFKLTFDTLTGASGSGAIPSTQIQTFTQPSGNGNYQVAGNEYPLDSTFQDTRVALNAIWSRAAWGNTKAQLGANISNEYDYLSFGLSSTFANNFNNANTTLTYGAAISQDTSTPVGGAPIAFNTMEPVGNVNTDARASSKDKSTIDIITGLTQTINANSLFQLNYSLSLASGYLNDPYKIISIVDSTTGRPIFENSTLASLPTVIYEKRPDSRTKHSFFGQYKRYFTTSNDVLDASYRFMLDDWGINSHTLDFRYRKSISGKHFVQPHIRFYQQGAADFYTPFLREEDRPGTANTPSFASADYRLGEFTGLTLGIEYGQVNARNSWSWALEYYLQTGDEPNDKFGELSQLELYPDVESVMLRLLYDF